MAQKTLPSASVQRFSSGGVSLTASAVNTASVGGVGFTAGTDSLLVPARTVLRITAGAASAGNLTVVTPGTVEGLAIADASLAFANSETKFVGPFGAGFQDNNGMVELKFPNVDWTVAAVAV